jgi:hypothetical protein
VAKNPAACAGGASVKVICQAAEAFSSSAAVRLRTARTSRRVAAVGLPVVEAARQAHVVASRTPAARWALAAST